VECEGGRLAVVQGGESIVAVDAAGKTIRRFDKDHPQFGRGWSKGDQYNFRSWLEAIRTRDRSRLTAEILEGHISTALCHTGMISHRLGERQPVSEIRTGLWPPKKPMENPFLFPRFTSFCEHLNSNGIDLETTCATRGPWLEVNVKNERFINNPTADALLSRDYRKPYVVPKIEAS
jgi:hypothetical protein